MDIRLFSLCKQEEPQIESGKKLILKCIKSFYPKCGDFMPFNSQKRMLLAVGQSLSAADIVIIAVQNNMYNATKRLLAEALGFRLMKKNAVFNVLNPLYEAGKIKQATLAANAFFPQGASLLPTESLINCGFILAAGSQCIIFLPIEEPFANEVVYGSLYDFLASVCDDAAAAKRGLQTRHKEILKRTADKLDTESVKIAFSYSPASEMIEKLSADIASKHCFTFRPQNAYFEITDEGIAEEARSLRDAEYANFGVVFSEVSFNQDSERILKAAIADENGTNICTFFAVENESDEEFISNCIDKIMLMFHDFENFGESKTSPDIATKADKSLRKHLLYIAAGAVGASTVIGFILAALL